MNQFTTENTPNFLAKFITENNLEIKTVAREINCSNPTLNRILEKETFPTENMIKQVGIMVSLGFEVYKKLSKSQKEKISEKIGGLGGGILGFGTIAAAVSASGTVVGLSAAGITSGLASIGGIVGGGMTAGVLTLAIIPVASIGIGYGIIKGVKAIISNAKLKDSTIDSYWEY